MIEDIFTIVPPWLVILLVIFQVMLGTAAYLILLERKIASWVQDRFGPNRVGPFGLLQPMADGLKMFTKEDYRSPGTDKWLFSFAPALMMLVVFVAMGVIPWGGIIQGVRTFISPTPEMVAITANNVIPLGASLHGSAVPTGNPNEYTATYRMAFQIADVNVGVLYVVAILSLAVYSIVFAGWASNNKFSFLGGMRAAAQIISYEVPLGLCIITIVLMFGTLSLSEITAAQAHYWMGFIPAWNIFCQPIAFLLFLVCLHAEANRAPFDLPEAEQELIAGYHTEYSSMRLGLLLMGEYIEMTVTSSVLVALFLGGWHFPGLTGDVDPANPAVTTSFLVILGRCAIYFAKVILVISLFMWVRWSLPRFRYDQLMNLAWRAFVPISLLMMLASAVVVYYFHQDGGEKVLTVSGAEALALLAVNGGVIAFTAIMISILPSAPLNRRILIPDSRFGNDRPVSVR